jgi:hypothetical protein
MQKNKKAQYFSCAQIVPVKVKRFKKFPNRPKNPKNSWSQINLLEIHKLLILLCKDSEAMAPFCVKDCPVFKRKAQNA